MNWGLGLMMCRGGIWDGGGNGFYENAKVLVISKRSWSKSFFKRINVTRDGGILMTVLFILCVRHILS